MAKVVAKQTTQLVCPVCLSDKLDPISPRMNKCESCGFIWNHEVSDRDNLMLIVEHQSKMANVVSEPPPQLRVVPQSKRGRRKKSEK
jgi:ribosomal protein L37AE/L43A